MTVAFAHDVEVVGLWNFGDEWLHFVPIDEQVFFVLIASEFHVRRQRFGVEQFLSALSVSLSFKLPPVRSAISF